MSEAEQDLDIAIGQYAELLASNLHAQRAAHFPPDAKKVMRTLTSGEAAELLGVDHTYLRKLHREGKIADVETTAGSHRRYTLDDIWEIRQERHIRVGRGDLRPACSVQNTLTTGSNVEFSRLRRASYSANSAKHPYL